MITFDLKNFDDLVNEFINQINSKNQELENLTVDIDNLDISEFSNKFKEISLVMKDISKLSMMSTNIIIAIKNAQEKTITFSSKTSDLIQLTINKMKEI